MGLLDRNIGSKTYGCFDRQYWHYNVVDFPCARYQEAVLTLALLYKIEDSPYYNNDYILEIINSAINYWATIQENNGSFNEWYPKENSFVATAFSTYAITESVLILGKDKIRNYSTIEKKIRKAGKWLIDKNELRVSNQQTGCIVALYNIFLLTGDAEYKKNAYDKTQILLKNQEEEGWFYEYGGADIGYLSLAIDYLSKFYKKTHNEDAFIILEKAIDFIENFIFDDGTAGGEFGSRNTEYLIPHGFEIMTNYLSKAENVAYLIRKGLRDKVSVSINSLDDRYLAYIGYTFLQAYLDGKNQVIIKEKAKQHYTYVKAGLIKLEQKKYIILINAKKGGVFKLYNSKNTINDTGVLLKLKNKYYYSGWLNSQCKFHLENDKLVVEGKFQKIKDNLLTPFTSILLKCFQLSIGRNEKTGLFIKNKLRDILITSNKTSTLNYRREIIANENFVEITDYIDDSKEIEEIILQHKDSYIYVPSSRYFSINELNIEPIIIKNFHIDNNKIICKRKVEFNDDQMIISF